MAIAELSTGVRLHYEVAGSGRPLVFLHGWAMSGRVWHFQQPLSESCRLIFLDQRGHGGSSPGDGYRLHDLAADLIAFFDHHDLADAVLVGWSMGVQVALQAFPQLKSRVAAMVLVGGTPRFTTADGYPNGLPPVEVKGMGVRLKRDYQKTMGDFFKGMFAAGELDKDQYQRIVHEIVMAGRSPDAEAAREALKILSVADLRDGLAAVDRQVLLVHGELDAICPASASRYMAERLPTARLEIMKGCGHAPFMTHPREFNDLVREFINGLGS